MGPAANNSLHRGPTTSSARQTIFISKYDYSDAYQRMAHSASAVAQTITACLAFAFVYFRMTFGGSPDPSTWCNFSEMVADLANEISMCKEWNQELLRSPNQPATPEPKRLDASIPQAPAREMAVIIPPIETGRVDVFIDDLVDTFPGTPENLARKAPRGTSSDARHKPAARREGRAHLEKGHPVTTQTTGGRITSGTTDCTRWLLDTWRLLMSLPADKYLLAWVAFIKNLMKLKGGTKEGIGTLEGQLNHAAYVIPLARHFLTRLRAASNSRMNKKSWIKLTRLLLADLELWVELLRRANIGISMSLIVTRRPSRLNWSDSCPFGLGGFLLKSGRAWRLRIPKESVIYGSPKINNLLEFLRMAVVERNLFVLTKRTRGTENPDAFIRLNTECD
jgi:hypothetical protein